MKKIISLLQLLFIIVIANAQCSWQYSSDRIYPLNNAGSAFSPYVKIGLGTNNPTAQFHTVSTVRFAGIANNTAPKRFIVSDSLGNLGWQDVAVLDNYWKKGGNTISNSNTEYFGSSNYKDVVFKTNNTTRLTISREGGIGIGYATNPLHLLEMKNYGPSFIVSQSDGGMAGIVLRGTGLANEYSFIDFGEYNSAVSLPNEAYGWNIAMQKTGTDNRRKLVFSADANNRKYMGCAMVFSDSYKLFFGIGTVNPTASLHVVDSVRFENLPSGTGNVLVIDAAGNVMRSIQTAAKTSNPKTEQLEARVALLEYEIAELKKMIKKDNIPTAFEESKLYQNIPNPSADITFIKMQIQDNAQHAVCNIYDANNQLIQSHTIKNRGEINLEVNTQNLSSTIYFYTLEIDGKIIDTKKLMIVK